MKLFYIRWDSPWVSKNLITYIVAETAEKAEALLRKIQGDETQNPPPLTVGQVKAIREVDLNKAHVLCPYDDEGHGDELLWDDGVCDD